MYKIDYLFNSLLSMSNNLLRERLKARRKELNANKTNIEDTTELEVIRTIDSGDDEDDTDRLQNVLAQQRAENLRRFEETDLREKQVFIFVVVKTLNKALF